MNGQTKTMEKYDRKHNYGCAFILRSQNQFVCLGFKEIVCVICSYDTIEYSVLRQHIIFILCLLFRDIA